MNFRFLNVPVYVHPSFLLVLVLLTDVFRGVSVESVTLAVIVAFSLLVHEYGHALTAKFFGASPSITLRALGGKAEYNGRGINETQNFLITLNGPLFESLLIVIPYAMLHCGVFDDHNYIRYFLSLMMRINIVWCLLNLIPITPLDGGYLTQYLLEKKFGESGHKASIIIGLIGVVAIAPYLFYLGFHFFGILILIYGYTNVQTLREMRVAMEGNNPFHCYSKGWKRSKMGKMTRQRPHF